MVQVRLFSAVVKTNSMEVLESSMNTFLKQHGNDAIEAIQVGCAESPRLPENEFIGIGMIAFIPRVGTKKKSPRRPAKK